MLKLIRALGVPVNLNFIALMVEEIVLVIEFIGSETQESPLF